MFNGIVEELGTVESLGPPMDKPDVVKLLIRTGIIASCSVDNRFS